MDDLELKLGVFEGPLDLLLHLIKTLEIDIYDIPIAEVTTQYMNYINTMKTLQLDVAGDYLVMAATLMAIKSKMLLPKQELLADDESQFDEGLDPRAALVAQLLEYRKYKYAATVLKEKEEDRSHYYTKEPSNLDEFKGDIPPLEPNEINTIDLFLAFHDILERRKSKEPRETTITSDSNTIGERMIFIRGLMKGLPPQQGVPFESLFVSFSRGEIVTTFLALLELMKNRDVTVAQVDNYQPILLYNPEHDDKEKQVFE